MCPDERTWRGPPVEKVRVLLSVAPHEFGIGVTISRDDRQIYFSLVTTEADIWLMNFE